jgi:uncharacterized protein YycO
MDVFIVSRAVELLLFIGSLNAAHAGIPGGIWQRQDCPAVPDLPSRAAMQAEAQDFLRLSEETLSARSQAIRLYRELDAKKAKRQPLSGEDLQRLNEGAVMLIQQRERLFRAALAHECWLAAPPAEGEAGEIQRAGALLSLSAALLLYDNYLFAVSLFRDDPELRQHLNRPDAGIGLAANQLLLVERVFNSPNVRRRVRRAMRWYLAHGAADSGIEGYGYLVQSIEQSPSFHLMRKKRPVRVADGVFKLFGSSLRDTLAALGRDGSQIASALFGNTMGLVETRKGKLFGQAETEKKIREALRAGDILLEKTPFRLTDKFILGHWGHAAIWVGTEAELKELGIWEHPVVRPHQAAIRSGRGVAEALRSGVELNPLAQFMNIDDFAALRPSALAQKARAEAILQALRQIGKDYDFNFDAETTDRMFCSKLVYLAYGGFDWPTSRSLGRNTVTPDDVARRALTADGKLAVALLYHDGESVSGPEISAMQRLLESGKPAAAGTGGAENKVFPSSRF